MNKEHKKKKIIKFSSKKRERDKLVHCYICCYFFIYFSINSLDAKFQLGKIQLDIASVRKVSECKINKGGVCICSGWPR